MTVLILAREFDPTADQMVTLLGKRGVEVFRVNTAWFPTQVQVSVELRDARWCGVLTAPRGRVDLDQVHAVWYRSPEAGRHWVPPAARRPRRYPRLARARPYHRIIATCSVPRIPWSWAEQLIPGGKVLADLKLGTSAGNLVLLHRYDTSQGSESPDTPGRFTGGGLSGDVVHGGGVSGGV